MERALEELGLLPVESWHLVRSALRLTAALVLGGIIGIDREWKGRAAGLRTHMLVAVGAALFTLVPLEAGVDVKELPGIVHGLAAGVGFLGAGAILKKNEQGDIEGITTAASIWLTAAIGFSTGAGLVGLAVITTILAWIVLNVLALFESDGKPTTRAKNSDA